MTLAGTWMGFGLGWGGWGKLRATSGSLSGVPQHRVATDSPPRHLATIPQIPQIPHLLKFRRGAFISAGPRPVIERVSKGGSSGARFGMSGDRMPIKCRASAARLPLRTRSRGEEDERSGETFTSMIQGARS